MRSTYRLGIDFGGTKISARALLSDGRAVNLRQASKGSLRELGVKETVKAIRKVVGRMQKLLRSSAKLEAVAVGISGLDSKQSRIEVETRLQKESWWDALPKKNRIIINDVLLGYYAGVSGKEGIAIVCGTGTNAFGRDKTGREAWASGRGSFLADEGSGYWIGKEGLCAAVRAEDGRGLQTKMVEMFLHKFHLSNMADLSYRLSDKSVGKRAVSALNSLVEKAAREGDVVAKGILDSATNELLLCAEALHRRLSFGKRKVEVVVFGGTIQKNLELQKRVVALFGRRPWIALKILEGEPVAGALKVLEKKDKIIL